MINLHRTAGVVSSAWRLRVRRWSPVMTGCILVAVSSTVSGQPSAGDSAFEVASVRQQERPAFRRPVIAHLPGGRFQAINATVRDLVAYAYGLSLIDLVESGQAWALNDKFDIAAKAAQDWPPGDSGLQSARRMTQRLLADRFNLTLRRAKRRQGGFALVLARADGRLGPRIRKSDVDCERLEAARIARIADGGSVVAPENQPGECNVVTANRTTRFRGHSMADLARYLSNSMRETVVDRTGLAGAYEMELSAAPGFVPEAAKSEMLAKGIEFAEPPIEVALREQLGLTIEKTTIEIDVVAIQRVERPTPN